MVRRFGLIFGVATALAAVPAAFAQTDSTARIPLAPPPASGLTWQDVPNDAGRGVTLSWTAPAAEPGAGPLDHFTIDRSLNPGGPWTPVDSTALAITTLGAAVCIFMMKEPRPERSAHDSRAAEL